MTRKVSQQDFINRCVAKHGGAYDYSKTVYVGIHAPITITCPTHGDFSQLANTHVRGGGCYHCGRIKTLSSRKISTAEFITRAKRIHGDRYDYSEAEYIKAKTPVKIKCPVHGYFEVTPDSHTGNKRIGCSKCAMEEYRKSKILTNQEFLSRCRSVHGDKYDYSETIYTASREKVSIRCREHGLFLQTANKHLSGQGCPHCVVLGYKTDIPGFVYILCSEDSSMLKVGLSNDTPRRFKELRNYTPFRFNVLEVYEFSGREAPNIEKVLHSLLVNAGLSGFDGASEWFRFDGGFLELVRATLG